MLKGVSKLECGAVSLIGRRRTMEDTFTMEPEIVTGRFSFFAVYDGHGGASVANACRYRLHKLLEGDLASIYNRGEEGATVDWTRIMKTCFSKMDDEMIKDRDVRIIPKEESSSTATVVIVGAEEIVVANCGDSRAVLCCGGVVVPLSTDHKANTTDEMERVEDSNGCCRVQGVLAVSRSIGALSLKPYVISEPTVTVNKRNESDEFIILATDGLWDVMSNEAACDIVRKRFNCRSETQSAADVAAFLAKMAIAKGSGDNVSVIVVKLETESQSI